MYVLWLAYIMLNGPYFISREHLLNSGDDMIHGNDQGINDCMSVKGNNQRDILRKADINTPINVSAHNMGYLILSSCVYSSTLKIVCYMHQNM